MKRRELGERVAALARATQAAAGRCDPQLVAEAQAVVQRAGERIGFDGEHTVVALAGATGSGKSSLFNALSGTQIAEVTVRRPTTARPASVAWGTAPPSALLDWLDVARRHVVSAAPDAPLAQLVLLDLPDHDSTELSHRLTVDRLVQRVDALLWVVDPQKYADAALHDGYLRPLAPYAELMVVVLNQADRLAPTDLVRCVADLRRLLDTDGLRRTPVVVTSAVAGTGIGELRDLLARTAVAKRAAMRRLGTDIDQVAGRLAAELGDAPVRAVPRAAVDQLAQTMGDAAGVPTVVAGVAAAWRRRGRAATGWPFTSWIARLRPDPLRRLRVALPAASAEVTRTALPVATPVQQARIEGGLRALTDAATAGLPAGWRAAAQAGVQSGKARLPGQLDAAIARTELGVERPGWWWGPFRFVQWLLLAAALLGGLAALYELFRLALGLPGLPEFGWYGLPVRTWLLVGGVVAGLALALVGRLLVNVSARRRARLAERALRASIAAVVASEVVAPVQAELDRYRVAVTAVSKARAR